MSARMSDIDLLATVIAYALTGFAACTVWMLAVHS